MRIRCPSRERRAHWPDFQCLPSGTTASYQVAENSSFSLKSTVVAGESFVLTVPGETNIGELDSNYVLPASATVLSSVGTLNELAARTANTITLSLSGLSDGESVLLTVMDGSRSGSLELSVDVVATRLALRANFSSTTVVARSADGGAALTDTLQGENDAGVVDSDVDFSDLGDLLTINTDLGRVVAPLLSSTSSANHIATLSLRYWPQSDHSSFNPDGVGSCPVP